MMKNDSQNPKIPMNTGGYSTATLLLYLITVSHYIQYLFNTVAL